MTFSIFTPSTVRKNKAVRKRLQTQKRAALDKYKLAQEQAETARYKAKAEAAKDLSTSDQSEEYKDTLFYDTSRDVTDEEDDDATSKTSSAATAEMYLNKKRLFGNMFKKLVSKRTKFELKLREFLCIVFSLQIPLVYLIRHVYVLNIWGAAMILLVFAIMEVVVAIPVFTVYMFLGNYGRRCYIKFWDCVPLFKGMAYSIAVTSLVYELLNVSFSSLALLYMKNMIAAEVPWSKCKFPNAHRDCIPTYGVHKPYTIACCDEDDPLNSTCKHLILQQCIKYGAADYYESYILQKGYVGVQKKNMILWKWVIAAIIEWFIIFILLSLGLKKYRGFMVIIHLALMFVVFFPGFMITLMISPKFNVIKQAKTSMDVIFHSNILFWLQTGVHILHSEVPSDVITFSSLSKPTENATLNTVFIYALKMLILTVISVWLSIFVKYIQTHYNVDDVFCIRAGGDQLVFAIIPDVFSTWPLPQLWLFLYFFIIFLWGLSTTIYALSSILEAVQEEFPKMFKWRIIVTGLLSISACTANIFFLRPNFINTFRYLTSHIFVYIKVAHIFLSLIAIFIYSINRFKNDYHFSCGIMLSDYWIHCLKIALIMLGVLFMLMYTLGIKYLQMKDAYFIIGLISPIIIGIVISTIRYILQLKVTLLDPDPKWGPVTLKKKIARARFDPTHELHFRSTSHSCKHNCLLTSSALKKDTKHWQSRRIICSQQLGNGQKEDD